MQIWYLHQKLQEVAAREFITSYNLEDGKLYCGLVNGSMGELEPKKCDDIDFKYYFICEKGEY